MLKIDSHQHYWLYDSDRFPWIDSSMKVLESYFLTHNLNPMLIENKIDGTVAVQAHHSETETEFLIGLAEDYKFIKGVVGWVDLTADNVVERLEFYSQNKLLKGIRHILQDEPEDFISRPDFVNGLGKLSKFNLTFDLVIHKHQLPAAFDLVSTFPDQKFVLDHIGKPRISDGIDLEWKSNMQDLSRLPNIYCKISGMVTEAKNFEWEKKDFLPFIEEVINAFGIERVMFGSDWPVCLLAAEYKEVVEIVEDYIFAFTISEQEKIMSGNAIVFYEL